MIDLILRASTKAAMATWLKTPPHDLIDADNNPVEGVVLSWWAESGKIMSAKPVIDASGNVTSPAAFLPGVAVLCRIHGSFFDNDKLTPDDADPDKGEQWARSRIARWIKNNGTPGKQGGITYYEVDGVRLYRMADVETWLAANDLPGHEFMGGAAG